MKIDITKKEYGTLLDILYIADWVLHSHKIDRPAETEEHSSLIQKLYSYAKDIGYEDFIEYSSNMEEYAPTKEYEETNDSMEFIEEFENDSFWEGLVERLALRDLIQQEGEDNLLNMEIKERLEKVETFRKKYYDEFGEDGLKNIGIR